MPHLTAARYGKDNIRVCKVEKDQQAGTQTVTEMTVCVLLEGDIETSYTRADNSVVVPTDTMKQTTYITAKQNPVNPPELFGSTLAQHFVDTYSWIHTAHVTVMQHRWTRMTIDGKPHPHSFFRDGAETRNVEVEASEKSGISIRSTISGLLVLKSTGSAFHGFNQDEYTILKPTNDRILSTSVDSSWTWKTYSSLKDIRAAVDGFDKTWDAARDITLKTFATDESPSVQNTMYKMCEQILDVQKDVQSVDYALPNKHYFEIDLSWHKGLKNTGSDAEVYAPQSDPNGLIKCTVSR
ncbi:MAG: hypothetical protein MMC23_000058 [Stictis urceolatum]|nr:hypothetical protein [Stictis urceolata]